MELYECARPELMSGKRILYVHGFASSGSNGSVKTLRLLLPEAEIIAPDLPVEPEEALSMLRELCASETPDLIVGTSMGAMYSEMLYGIDRILVNPAFHLADTLLKNNGMGRQEYHNPRQDGETSFLVNKSLIESFREVSSHCFEKSATDQDKVYGLFGIHDTMVHTFDVFSEHYPFAIHYNGEHYLNDAAILHSLLPVISWIDDKQNSRGKRVIFISLSDRLMNHSTGFDKAVSQLSVNYDVQIVTNVPYNNSSRYQELVDWCETNLGVTVWNKVTACNNKSLLMGDYLIDAEPNLDKAEDFLGTCIHYGSDAFKTWEEVLDYFSRLGGQ